MKRAIAKEIVYSLNINDIQDVAKEFLDRRLTKKEISAMRDSIGDYIDWVQAIENAIYKRIVH